MVRGDQRAQQNVHLDGEKGENQKQLRECCPHETVDCAGALMQELVRCDTGAWCPSFPTTRKQGEPAGLCDENLFDRTKSALASVPPEHGTLDAPGADMR